MKLNKIITIIAITVLSASCQDFLNLSDPNAVTTGNYYQNETDMQSSLNGAYAALKDGYFMGNSNPYFEECKARILTYPDTGVNAGENASFDNCTVVPSNQFVLSRWNSIYKCIDRANVLLKHLDDITYTDASVRNNLEGEARFIRALCYFTLVCDWGDAPVVLSKLESLSEVNENNVRKPKAEVYKAIYDDCEWVISKNMQSENNLADTYIAQLQGNKNTLDAINQSIRKYNQSIEYCREGHEDMAIMQLKKVVSKNPKLVKAQQLLALLYMKNKDYVKELIRKSGKIETEYKKMRL